MDGTARSSRKLNYSERCFVKSAVLLCLLVAVTSPVFAAEEASPAETFSSKNQVGGRLGVWANLGDTPKEDTAGVFKTSIGDASFYFEGYYAHRFHPLLMGEISLSIVNRGSVTFRVENRDNIGNLMVYSFLLNAKVYPFGSTGWRVQPYVAGGGGLYYGRRSVQFTSSIVYYPGLDEESATDFNFTVAAGFDYPLTDNIGLDFNARYVPITFGDPLMTIDDYEALAFSVGVKYLYQSSDK